MFEKQQCRLCQKREGTISLLTIDDEEYFLCEPDYLKLKNFYFGD